VAEPVETWAVLAAGGSGVRLAADRPKAFVALRGRPLVAHSLELLEDHPAIDGVVIVVPAGWEERASLLVDDAGAGKVAAAVAGGASRGESVAAGLDAVPARAGVVLVHDAARPFAGADLVDRVLAGLADADGAVPAVRVSDTVKEVAGGQVRRTLDRAALVAVQTPQAFRAEPLRRAYAAPPARLRVATDCASLLESEGLRVVTVVGDRGNIKVTDPWDMRLAEALSAC
jgi:2-C-methyl-D-erythritol 4-phosphate cytidylyltransferase